MKETTLSIIPLPVSCQFTDGFFLSRGLPTIKGDGMFRNEIDTVNGQLREDLERMGLAYIQDREGKAVICQMENNPPASPAPSVMPALLLNNEGYRITITKENITINAASGKGMYHGLQSFRQLVLSEYKGFQEEGRFNESNFSLSCGEIIDYPRFPWRGFMLDCSRYFYSITFIKHIIDVLSLHHINRFHWHLSDDQGWRLPVPEYPLLTETGSLRKDHRMPWIPFTGGFYSEEAIRNLVEYAAKRHIDVVPEIDLPGHASAILAAYPDLGCTGGPYHVEDRFGIFEDVLCAGNNRIFDLIAKVFDSLVWLFPSSYVHIGGDEVLFNRWKACPKCQKRLSELGLKKPKELQSWITQRLVTMLAERGKTAIGWDEVLEDSQQFRLPKETVVMSWRGSKGGIAASKRGHPVIMVPNTEGCYLDYKHIDDPEEPGQTFNIISTVYKSYCMNPVAPQMTEEESSQILGGQCNLWSELIYAGKIAEYMIFPRLCAVAEAVWTPPENKNFDDFSRRLITHQKRLDLLGLLQYRGPLR
ncbi:MAG: beta-N-acetylhexosaminidase [Treponema sp.]|nr:beta-N-acetylhexosaminidase [Treponema sp.]